MIGLSSIFSRWKAWRERRRLGPQLGPMLSVKEDFSTPEGAVLCLEDTYKKRDLEAAIACHDFETEAKLHLRKAGYSGKEMELLLPKLTEVMEETYRSAMAREWPSALDETKSYFVEREPYAENIVVVNEIKVGPDGSSFRQHFIVSKTPSGWRVVMPVLASELGLGGIACREDQKGVSQ